MDFISHISTFFEKKKKDSFVDDGLLQKSFEQTFKKNVKK